MYKRQVDTLNYTGAIQTYVVPSGVTSVTIEAYGAQGGTAYSIFDGGKGALAVILARIISEDAAITASICVIVGHIYPVWMKFNGGKGVATFIGVILALNFVAGVLVCSVWLIIALAFRYSSLAALISSISALIWVLFFYGDKALIVTLIMIMLIWLRHKENIKKLIEGSEKKIGDH